MFLVSADIFTPKLMRCLLKSHKYYPKTNSYKVDKVSDLPKRLGRIIK